MTRSTYALVFCFCAALGLAARSIYTGHDFWALVFFGSAFVCGSIYRWERATEYVTTYWPKPMPLRDCDWTATEQDYEGGDPVGYGATREDAVADLREQLTNKRSARTSGAGL